MSESLEGPIFTVYDSNCYWSMPDGSNRCITDKDAAMINASGARIAELEKALRPYGDIERFRARIAELEAEVARLREDCSQFYQIIGALSGAHADMFDTGDVQHALDNALAAAEGNPRQHDDLLPFPKQPVR